MRWLQAINMTSKTNSMKNRSVEPVYKRIGRRITRAREAASMTQERLGFLIGQSRVSVYNIEHGTQRVPIHVLGRIARALDWDMVDLLD